MLKPLCNVFFSWSTTYPSCCYSVQCKFPIFPLESYRLGTLQRTKAANNRISQSFWRQWTVSLHTPVSKGRRWIYVLSSWLHRIYKPKTLKLVRVYHMTPMIHELVIIVALRSHDFAILERLPMISWTVETISWEIIPNRRLYGRQTSFRPYQCSISNSFC